MSYGHEVSFGDEVHQDSGVYTILASAELDADRGAFTDVPLGRAVERELVRVLPLVRKGRREGGRRTRRAPSKARFDLWSEVRLAAALGVEVARRTTRVEVEGDRAVARALIHGVAGALCECGTEVSAHDAPAGVTLRAKVTDATAIVRELPTARRCAATLGLGVQVRMRDGWAVVRLTREPSGAT